MENTLSKKEIINLIADNIQDEVFDIAQRTLTEKKIIDWDDESQWDDDGHKFIDDYIKESIKELNKRY